MSGTVGYKWHNGKRAVRWWIIPYLHSRLHSGEFRPVLCYLFTEWKCNVDCFYCHQYANVRPGMSLDVAKTSIDWLRSLGCRVIPIMGGEPLLRKDYILEVIRYGASKGFFMYLPTNGYLLDKPFIDEVGRSGVAAINLAVDCVDRKKGLPKALRVIEPQFRYLVDRQKKYGYLLFFNINICANNIEDVKVLTEIAHENRVGTDYHLNEPAHDFLDTSHHKHKSDDLSVRPEQYAEVNQLLDWLIERQMRGWPMVNSIEHLRAFKQRMRGEMKRWDCRAGINGALIRTDGTLSPCFDMIHSDDDWGRVGDPKFEAARLKALKDKCLPHCSSTCFYTMAYYYRLPSLFEWVRKHVRVG